MLDEDDPNDATAGCRLKEPIDIDALLNTQRAEFSVRDDDFMSLDEAREEDTQLNDVYKFEEYEPYIYVDSDSGDEENNGGVNSDGSSDEDAYFQSLRKKMFNLRDDGKVMKRIVRNGSGERIPENDGSTWIIYVHYSAHVEYGDTPYDCTYLRQRKPLCQRLGPDSGFIAGYDIALRSMRKGEKARFLIHPDLGYGEKGAPPRIPAKAKLHFEIELFDFAPAGEKETGPMEAPLPETCQDRIQKARRCRQRGNKHHSREKNVNGAISQYRKGIGLLLQYRMANEEEEAEIRDELIKLYANLAVCHLRKEEYKRVCIAYNDALHDCGAAMVNESVKLNYVSAKALRFLCNYDLAKIRLNKALRLKTGDKDIVAEMNKLDDAIYKARREERSLAQRMMGFRASACPNGDAEDDIKVLANVSDEWKEIFLEILDEFLANPEEETKRVDLEYTHAELKYCQRVCQDRNVGIRTTNERIILLKRSF